MKSAVLVLVAFVAGAMLMRPTSTGHGRRRRLADAAFEVAHREDDAGLMRPSSSTTPAGHGRRRRHLADAAFEAAHREDDADLMRDALELDHFRIGWMMMAIVLMQAVLDGILRRVEMSVGGSSKILLTEIYKELTTLGIISFILFLVQAFADSIEEEALHAFEVRI